MLNTIRKRQVRNGGKLQNQQQRKKGPFVALGANTFQAHHISERAMCEAYFIIIVPVAALYLCMGIYTRLKYI